MKTINIGACVGFVQDEDSKERVCAHLREGNCCAFFMHNLPCDDLQEEEEQRIKDLAWLKIAATDKYIFVDQNNTDTLYSATLPNIGRISVLDRLTGFMDGRRDIETGFRDKRGEFWLASGNFDIRNHGELTITMAIQLIKASANTCVGREYAETVIATANFAYGSCGEYL